MPCVCLLMDGQQPGDRLSLYLVLLDPGVYLVDEEGDFVDEEGGYPGQSQSTPCHPDLKRCHHQEHTQCHLQGNISAYIHSGMVCATVQGTG